MGGNTSSEATKSSPVNTSSSNSTTYTSKESLHIKTCENLEKENKLLKSQISKIEKNISDLRKNYEIFLKPLKNKPLSITTKSNGSNPKGALPPAKK